MTTSIKNWRKAVHDGVVTDTQSAPRTPDWKFVDQLTAPVANQAEGPASKSDELEITFCPDPTIWDGRFANSGWLQELAKPLTKLTWDNAALISPKTAERLRLSNEELVELSLDGRTVRAPIWIVPGQPDNSISLSLGYGRTHSGRIGKGIGVNAYTLRPARNEWFADGVSIEDARAADTNCLSRRIITAWKAAIWFRSEHSNSSGKSLILFPPNYAIRKKLRRSIQSRPNRKMPGACRSIRPPALAAMPA